MDSAYRTFQEVYGLERQLPRRRPAREGARSGPEESLRVRADRRRVRGRPPLRSRAKTPASRFSAVEDLARRAAGRRGPDAARSTACRSRWPRARAVAVVGESGCGKTQLARAILGLAPDGGACRGGSSARGASSRRCRTAQWRAVRGRRDRHGVPGARGRAGSRGDDRSADRRGDPICTGSCPARRGAPQARVERSARGRVSRSRRGARRVSAPALRGTAAARLHRDRPGVRRRSVLLADEPTASLDATVAAQVLELLDRLRRERGLAVLLITHDLGARRAGTATASWSSTRDASSRRPRRPRFFRAPAHPYTRGLLRCGARARARGRAARASGTRPSPASLADLSARPRAAAPSRRAARSGSSRARRSVPALYPAGEGRLALLPVYARPRGAAREPPRRRRAAAARRAGSTKRFAVHARDLRRASGSCPRCAGVSFAIAPGQTLGSRRGVRQRQDDRRAASSRASSEPDAGRILFDGEDWLALSGAALRRRRRELQVVFQDPQTSLNPAHARRATRLPSRCACRGWRAGRALAERVARAARRRRPRRRDRRALSVGALGRAAAARRDRARARDRAAPGRLRRAGLGARRLGRARRSSTCCSTCASAPGSPTSSSRTISPWSSRIADRIAVLYLGADRRGGARAATIVGRPLHPYTAALVAAVPEPDPGSGARAVLLPGEPPSAVDPPSGLPLSSALSDRARRAAARRLPVLSESEAGRRVACFYPGEMRVI